MTLRQTTVVDWLGIEKQTGDILLTLIDDEDWSDEEEHLKLLQAKLNTYIAFIESGEVYERLREDAGRSVSAPTPVKVQIVPKYDLPLGGSRFLSYAKYDIRRGGRPAWASSAPEPGLKR